MCSVPFDILYIAPVFQIGKMGQRLLKGEIFQHWQLGLVPIFPLSEFSSEEIETFHLGETGAIKSRRQQSVL